jgi:NADH-quinone oxidoreductase subunit C
MPISSAVAALVITSVLSGCGGTSVERVAGPTTTSGAAATAGAVKTAEAAAVAEAARATEAATVAQAKIAADAKAAAAATAVTSAKAKAAAAAAAAAKAKPAAVRPATLLETCPKVEKALSGLTGKSSPPTASKLAAAMAQVKLLNEAGDAGTRKALSALLAALPGFQDEDPAWVANEGRRAVLDALAALATRCQAVGSSALQWVG